MGVIVRVGQDVITTGTGTDDFLVSDLGGATVQGVLCFMTTCTADGTRADHAQFCFGGSDFTNQSLVALSDDHGVTTTATRRNMETDELIQLINGAGTVDGEADIDSTPLTNGFRVNIGNQFASAYRLKYLVFAGSDVSCKVGSVTQDQNVNVAQAFTGIGFQSDVIFFWTTTGATGAPGSTQMVGSFGIAVNDGTPTNSMWVTGNSHGQTTTDNHIRVHNNRVAMSVNAADGSISRSVELTAFGSDGFTLTKREASINLTTHYFAVNFNGKIQVKGSNFDAPTASGNWAQTWPGFRPQAVLMGLSMADTINAAEDANIQATAVGVSVFDADEEWCIGISSEDNVGTSNTSSLAAATALNFDDSQGATAFVATGPSGSGSFDTLGHTLDVTSFNSTARKWFGVAFEEDSGATASDAVTLGLTEVPAVEVTGQISDAVTLGFTEVTEIISSGSVSEMAPLGVTNAALAIVAISASSIVPLKLLEVTTVASSGSASDVFAGGLTELTALEITGSGRVMGSLVGRGGLVGPGGLVGS